MSYDPQTPSDRADQAPDAYDGRDWNADLHAPCLTPPPTDREIWIVTDDGKAHPVRWCDQAKYYLGEDVWRHCEGEPGSWELDEILGWTESHDDAQRAAAEFKAFWA